MSAKVFVDNGILYRSEEGSTTAVIPFGKDSLHIVSCKNGRLDISAKHALALDDNPEPVKVAGDTHIEFLMK